ncbi:MAG TPA: vanadium-dependent haloperoxidase [Patescibacteria group bacterium]|nr:vanadium-dependent haloperoxidase [Patescibacteria group bacterium]
MKRELGVRRAGARAGAALVTLLLVTLLLGSCTSSPPYVVEGCQPADREGRSVARIWDEQLLSLIRQVVPAPTVHARNLFHLSVAMWDAWAAYDDAADGYQVTEKLEADDVAAAREAAISFAAYRLLAWRYAEVGDLDTAMGELDATMASLCYRTDVAGVDGTDPAAFGNRIAAAVIAAGAEDGSLEETRYVDSAYLPVNDPLEVAEPGVEMADPNRWQPLALARQLSQNGLPIPGSVQTFIGPHWGHVNGFALPPSEAGTPIDPGPPPRLGEPGDDATYQQAALEILRYSSQLDPSDGVVIDASPGALGDNPLGSDDGDGHDLNPATGEPYAPNRVLRADYARALAEYWADGPHSETPPGHWNLIANDVSDALGDDLRIGGEGEPVDRLEWDVKLYLALNGAQHDAAIAAWGLKGYYDSPRPISMIRYLGSRGQSSDPSGPGYDPEGLPLEPGLVEVVTEASSARGQRHEHLADHVGEVAVRAWRGFPEDPERETAGVGWILATEWVPYQRSTFVSPAFAGYVSGHSTFSRAGAEVMEAMTGDPFFPGGLHEWTLEKGDLIHEEGPTETITLGWATYADAADAAGRSRLYMGIHIAADDVEGRRIGAACGDDAWALATAYFDGSARH